MLVSLNTTAYTIDTYIKQYIDYCTVNLILDGFIAKKGKHCYRPLQRIIHHVFYHSYDYECVFVPVCMVENEMHITAQFATDT